MKKEKIHTKKEQAAMAEYLTKKFAEIDRQQDLIPVIMQRGQWEALKYTIELALKLEHKRKNKGS
jgi:hypothetical protein